MKIALIVTIVLIVKIVVFVKTAIDWKIVYIV